LCTIRADIGAPVRLAGDFLEKNYEQQSDGIDSGILKIDGIDSFNVLIGKNKKAIVIRCFSGLPQASDKSGTFFQGAAEYLGEKALCYSVDFNDNLDIVEQLTVLFTKVSIGNKALSIQNPVLYSFLLSLTHQLVHVLRDGANVSPFFLFFKNGTMVVPGNIKYSTQGDLLVALNQQLARLEAIPTNSHLQSNEHSHPLGQKKQPEGTSFLQKTKAILKGWFSKTK
jgi:hypothetical protein